jgi:hypothetical protein
MNNQSYQKYPAEQIKDVQVSLEILLDKLTLLIQDMIDECDSKGGCCK